MNSLKRAFLWGALVALAGMPLLAAAATDENTAVHPTDRVTYDTTLISVNHPSGAYEGVLNVTIADDGTISGFFRPADSGRLVDVYGGLTGDKVSLTIGSGTPITGTYDHGRIIGYTFVGPDLQRFVATPARPNL